MIIYYNRKQTAKNIQNIFNYINMRWNKDFQDVQGQILFGRMGTPPTIHI